MAQLISGWTTGLAIIRALGLDGLHVEKVVIEAGCCDVTRFYLKTHADVEQIAAVAKALAGLAVVKVDDVSVTDTAEVVADNPVVVRQP